MLARMPVPAQWDIFTRDAITSALYVAIVLLAALVALPDEQVDEPSLVASATLGTAVGLVLAHWFAFRVAAALFDGVGRTELLIGAADMLAGFVVGALAAGAALVSVDAAMLVLGGVVGGAGYAIGRRSGAGRIHAIGTAAIVLAAAAGVIAVKIAIDY